MSSGQEPAAQITNTLFPPPPEFYKQFTDENVARYDALKENEAGPSRSPRGGSPGRVELGAEERQEPEGLRASLEPPRADWIEEEGRWVTFGEMHTVSHTEVVALLGLVPQPVLSWS
jgi:mediator of RNA polymerase II transcription subunit 7